MEFVLDHGPRGLTFHSSGPMNADLCCMMQRAERMLNRETPLFNLHMETWFSTLRKQQYS